MDSRSSDLSVIRSLLLGADQRPLLELAAIKKSLLSQLTGLAARAIAERVHVFASWEEDLATREMAVWCKKQLLRKED